MTARRELMLQEMRLGPLWKLRLPPSGAVGQGSPELVAGETPDIVPETAAFPHQADVMNWEELAAAVRDCRRCRLCETRQQAVLGVGDTSADWLFVGEGPGAEEDQRGEPFVGQAGKLLDNMLASIGLKRGKDVYIANAVKCRPPGNRTPEPEEIAACRPYLERQIALLQPRLIVALGRPAAQTLLQCEVKIATARSRLHEYQGIALVVTYHPAYLLRNLPDKAKAWEDLCLMRRTMKATRGENLGEG